MAIVRLDNSASTVWRLRGVTVVRDGYMELVITQSNGKTWHFPKAKVLWWTVGNEA